MNRKFENLKADQGWTDETFLSLVMAYIHDEGHETTLYRRLKQIADSENDADAPAQTSGEGDDALPIDRTVVELREKFKGSPRVLQFINDMVGAGFKVWAYSARGMEGKETPAVTCTPLELPDVLRSTLVKTLRDSLGKDFVVYVR